VSGLDGTVAVVTGASRGLGKGIALGLGEAGATVYVTGRSTRAEPGALPGTIDETADELTRLGGRGLAARCDHRNDSEVQELFARVLREEGRLDLLVNNAFASPDQRVLWSGQRFWEIPVPLWDDLIDVGLRSHFIASRCAANAMVEQEYGLIVNVASHASGRGKSAGADTIVPYSVCKAGLHRLTSDMAAELREYGVAVIAVWPPGSRTEGVLARPELVPNLSEWKEPIFTGRVVADFAMAGKGLECSGEALVITELAEEFGLSAK
jgi:dehydrogenase/reductase SDR family protein 1